MYKTIVFDLDGTLLDTLDDLYAAVNAALGKYGLPLRTREEVRTFVGNGAVNLMRRASDGKWEIDELMQVFNSYYKAHCADKTKPYDGILELLQYLKAQGVQTAVLSNKPDFAVKMLVKDYFGDLCSIALGENEKEGIRKKPAPDALYSVLKTLGAEKSTAVYVGDSEVDIQTAKNAGVDCISVSWGFKTREFLLQNGATTIVDTPNDLLEILKKSC